jgi:hypothetical protein
MRGITKKQFAVMQKVSPARVSQWTKTKIISTLPDGTIDPIKGERDLLKNRDATKRLDWESSFNRQIRPERIKPPLVEEYEVLLPFTEKINGREFLIPKGSTIRVTSRGILFIPPGSQS